MRVVSTFLRSKVADRSACEDVIATVDGFSAVFDGATDVRDRRFGGVSGGRLAAQTAANALADLDPAADMDQALAHLSRAMTAVNFLGEEIPFSPGVDRPGTAMLVLSHARRELWRVGDCGYAIDGTVDLPEKPVDVLAYGLRSAYTHALLRSGADPAQLSADDPGFGLLKPFYVAQRSLTNRTGPYTYGVLDGSPVPAEHAECIPIGPDARRVVLVTDGYPFILGSLSETEAELRALMERDPLGISEWIRPAALGPTRDAFDDRAWVEVDATR